MNSSKRTKVALQTAETANTQFFELKGGWNSICFISSICKLTAERFIVVQNGGSLQT